MISGCPRDSFKSLHNLKASILQHSAFLSGPNITCVHDYWENHTFDYMDLCQQSDVSGFSYTKFVLAFLLRSKHLLLSWVAVILEPKEDKEYVNEAGFIRPRVILDSGFCINFLLYH